MRNAITTCLTLLTLGTPVAAQELSEVCPGAPGGTGAIWGVLSDADAEMALPGATVVASWSIDRTPGRAVVQTSIDGSFTLCDMPLDTELSVVGMIGSIPGQALAVTLMDPITRLDVEVPLTGANAGGEKMLACPGAPNSQLRLQVSDLVHCDPRWRGLENCPREDLGRVSVASPDTPSLSDRLPGLALLITQARELGANALLNFWESGIVGRRSAGSPGGGLLSAQAVFIDVDPATC